MEVIGDQMVVRWACAENVYRSRRDGGYLLRGSFRVRKKPLLKQTHWLTLLQERLFRRDTEHARLSGFKTITAELIDDPNIVHQV